MFSLSACADGIAGRVRNDGIGHPGPDPGSNSSVCADEFFVQTQMIRVFTNSNLD